MKKYLITILTIVACNFVFAQGNFNYDNFTAVSLTCSADVEITKGNFSIDVTGDAKLMERLEMEVKKNALEIKMRKGSGGWSAKEGLNIRIQMPELTAIASSASGDILIRSDFSADEFAVAMSGSGDVSTDNATIKAQTLALVVSGSGDVRLSGTASKQAITASGSGDIELDNFRGKNVSVVNSGSADVEVYATDEVSLVNSGSGDIEVSGSPEKKAIVNTGSGDIDYR